MVTKLRASLIATLVALFLVLAVCATLAAAIWIARQQAIEDWQQQVDKLSLVLAEQTAQEIRSAVLVLDSIADSMAGDDIFTEAQMRARTGSASWFASLRDKIQGLPQVDVASIVASNGDLLNFTRVHPAPAIKVADRDYFEVHQRQGEHGVYISAPVRNRGNGEWTFYLSRRLNSPGGEFLGVALVGFSSTFLADFYQKIRLGQGASVLLSRHDGMLMARWPHDDQAMGQLVAPARAAAAEPGVGAPNTVSSVRQVDKYGMAIRVSVPDQLYLAQWRRFAAALALAGAVTVAAILAAFVVLVRALRRREADMENMRALQAAAEAANRAKSAFLAMMSHEIRTPLTAIIGFADLLQKDGPPAGRADAAAIIGRQGQHLLDVINDMLDISKIEAGRLHFETLPFAPGELAASVAATMTAQAHARAIGFTLSLSPSLPSAVMGDPTRFRQILFNLCGNAVKFTEQGGVGLALGYERASNTLSCTVSDSGIGMSAQQLAQLFQPFVQADGTVARRYGGSGLGLYLVQQLVGSMGGKVTVDSVPGQGSVFRVVLPAAPAPGAVWGDAPAVVALPPAAAAAALPALRGHILLAEDGIDNRRLVGLFLDRVGLSHEAAGDGAVAVELAMTGRFDLVLMDIRMPVLDGVQALQTLRARGFSKPVIALTANLMEEDLRRYADAGFDRSIGKPIDFAALHAALAALLAPAAPPCPHSTLAAANDDVDDPLAAIRAAFRTSLGPRLASLEQWVGAARWHEAAELAHQLRGAGGSFGYPGLSRCARELEVAALAGDSAAAAAALAALLALEELRSVSPA